MPDTLPEWDLSDLYPEMRGHALQSDLGALEAEAKDFAAAFRGKIADADGAAFADALETYERLSEGLGRVASYAQLCHAEDMTDPERGGFYQDMNEAVTDLSSALLFFTLEINRLDDDALEAKLAEPRAAKYRPWLRDVRVYRDHQLSDEVEELLHEKQITGRDAWNRLFDQTMAGLKFEVDGESLNVSQALNLLSDKDEAKRKAAAKSVGKVLGDNIATFALITNTLAKDKAIEDGWRKYPHAVAARNLSNQVEDDVVEALTKAVQDAYPRLAHRYYAIKAKWMGKDKLAYWDRNAPLPEDDDTLYTWDQARDTVLKAYNAFSPEVGGLGQKFFDNAWIDAPPRDGKASGAFAHPTVPSAHPYLLVNFLGKSRDVMTLAHELGHGVHQVLAGPQGYLMADTPLTLAETASVFGEMMTFRSLLDEATDPIKRRVMLAGKIEDMLNTVVRQIAFFEFEKRLHAERRNGELSATRIGEIWMDIQSESLGPAITFEEEYATYWAYIPHFVHSPFYVYAYAFGDCLVNALYDVYQSGGVPDFQAKYMDMLKSGGTLRHKDLLAPFGLDASDPAFWNRGLTVIEGLIDELEAAL